MFEKLKNLIGASPRRSESERSMARLAAMQRELGDAEYVDHDSSIAHRVDIYAFGRNFIEVCDDDSADDEAYVLMTSGMSNRIMHAPKHYIVEEPPAIELIWYVRDLNPEYFSNLRWLAEFPFIDQTWLGDGHTIPMPEPPLSFCAFKTFFFLPPVIKSDKTLFENLGQGEHAVGTLAVHLISDAEYKLVNSNDGLNKFLDLLDQNGYPAVFDPARVSYVG
jgi:hypothetical protein